MEREIERDDRTGARLPGWMLWALVLCALLYGVLSGFRVPSLWSVTALVLDYHAGFTKRGALGALLGGDAPQTYQQLAVFAFAVLAAFVAVLTLWARQMSARFPDVWLVLAAFFLSLGFLFLVHDVGYADVTGLLIGLVAMRLPMTLPGHGIRALLVLFLILVHEALFLLVVPLVFFDIFARMLTRTTAPRVGEIAGFAGTCLVAAGVTYWVASLTLDPSGEAAALTYYGVQSWDFPVRSDMIAAQFRDAAQNRDFIRAFWADPETPGHLFRALAQVLPYTLVMLGLTVWLSLRAALTRGRGAVLAASAAVVTFLPLALFIWAWDIERFAAQTQVMASVAMLTLAGLVVGRGQTLRLPPVGLALLVAASLWNAAATPRLFDGYEVRRPPFDTVLPALKDYVTEHGYRLRPPKA